jgi:iron complex transport system substrate-binding protein
MANPDLTTYGRGKYTGLMMERAGARNVASSIAGFKQVTMEDVLTWDPAVIFVQERYPAVVDEIKKAVSWQTIDAVKNGRIYLMPEYAKAWGYPMPEAMALGELWMAKELYPERFKDIDMQKEVDAYYKEFYRTDYRAAQ